jgi:hypothetical protein
MSHFSGAFNVPDENFPDPEIRAGKTKDTNNTYAFIGTNHWPDRNLRQSPIKITIGMIRCPQQQHCDDELRHKVMPPTHGEGTLDETVAQQSRFWATLSQARHSPGLSPVLQLPLMNRDLAALQFLDLQLCILFWVSSSQTAGLQFRQIID